jgi:(S)-2-hydroxyglutarate dehydrogenase
VATTDFLIIGAGIIGLTIARELKKRYPDQKIIVLEKEAEPGKHSSGRNSGVLHSGIYYSPESLKAKVCRQGAVEMAEYHDRNQLPLNHRGKILVATCEKDMLQLNLLADRAKINCIQAEYIDAQTLKEIEPEARSAVGTALWIPSTAVGDPAGVMNTMITEIVSMKVELRCAVNLANISAEKRRIMLTDGSVIQYGHIINAAGLYADRIAHRFDVGNRYTSLPFKGIYWKLNSKSKINIKHLIYPVPDLRVPFLGVHTTTTIDGETYLGPTAVPAFGRENYYGIKGVTPFELIRISSVLMKQCVIGKDGFRRLAWQEGRRYLKPWFVQAAQAILPRLRSEDLVSTEKVGIRAQILDKQTGRLVTDFLVEGGQFSTHILNAISPAWTSAFPLARHICDQFIERKN